ncbi:MAG: putative nitroreductase [Ilumatobacteraceae bacterium]|nr:putative nitroreductase [Ilumatobacteraceae bacterium]
MLREHEVALAPLLTRQSVSVLSDVAPSAAEIDAILQASVTVPDHGNLRPWRLVVVEGDARAAFGDALAAAGREANPALPDEIAGRLRGKAFAAPALIAVVARIDPAAKIAVWEQVASASCAGYAITLAAHQLGIGAIWKSSPFQEGAALRRALDMGPDDQFLGWVNLGRIPAERPATDRAVVDLAPIARRLDADGTVRQLTA